LELKINTSSTNTIQFGIVDSSGARQFFKIGNTLDRWEAFTSNSVLPLGIGPNQEFSSSTFKGKIEIKFNKDSIILTTIHQTTQNTTVLKIPFLLNNVNQFYMGIQQSGKTAIQAHRITNITIDSIRKLKFNVKNIRQLNAREIIIESMDILKPNQGQVRINQSLRIFKLNPNQQTLIVLLKSSDTSKINITLDSFYNIWNTPLELVNFYFTIKTITPIQRGDIVITEIMPDPEPAINRFPATEYFEIHNNSNSFKQANELSIIYNNKPLFLPADSLIPPQQTILLVPQAHHEKWTIWALNKLNSSQFIWTISNFPNLINSEGTLLIKSAGGVLLDSLKYEVSMHEVYAVDGGHSYETHNLNPKSNHLKWKSAPNFGGSPTALNTTFNNHFPVAIEEFYKTNDSVNIKFNISHQLIDFNLSKIEEEFQIQAKSIKYNEKLVFNEILCKSPTNTDFIEIFNPTMFPVSLENYDLLIYDINQQIKQVISLKNPKRNVIMPGEYLVFCNNLFSLQRQFNFAHSTQIVGLPDFPNLIQDGGYLKLVNQIIGIVDECSFEIHKPLNRLSDFNNSLEKSHPSLLSNDSQNWMDCVSELGASPTVANSTLLNQKTLSTKWTHISDKRLYKKASGYYEIPIEFNIPYIGNLLSINIFTIWGEKVISICENTAIPSQGVIQWPLIHPNKDLIKGNYIITFEISHQIKGVKLEYHRISLL